MDDFFNPSEAAEPAAEQAPASAAMDDMDAMFAAPDPPAASNNMDAMFDAAPAASDSMFAAAPATNGAVKVLAWNFWERAK